MCVSKRPESHPPNTHEWSGSAADTEALEHTPSHLHVHPRCHRRPPGGLADEKTMKTAHWCQHTNVMRLLEEKGLNMSICASETDRGGCRFCLRLLTAAANVPPYYPPIQEHVHAAMHVLGVYNGRIINRHTNAPYCKGHKGKLAKGQQSLNKTFLERQKGTFWDLVLCQSHWTKKLSTDLTFFSVTALNMMQLEAAIKEKLKFYRLDQNNYSAAKTTTDTSWVGSEWKWGVCDN